MALPKLKLSQIIGHRYDKKKDNSAINKMYRGLINVTRNPKREKRKKKIAIK